MAKNQTGIAIVIKAFLPTGSTIDEQFTALSIVKDAHASGDYTALLKAAKVEEVKTEQKTRRVEEEPATTADNTTATVELGITPQNGDQVVITTEGDNVTATVNGDEVPAFIKKGKEKAA